jgi:very-short-patch-repair endonuclease
VRDRLLVARGWRVVRVTARQLEEAPDEVARDLRRALSLGAR